MLYRLEEKHEARHGCEQQHVPNLRDHPKNARIQVAHDRPPFPLKQMLGSSAIFNPRLIVPQIWRRSETDLASPKPFMPLRPGS
jgi:hypothetical protein